MQDSLTIGFVLDDSLDKTDGVQQYVLTLSKWLTTQGHTVHYLVGETRRTDLPNVHSLCRNINVRFNGNKLSVPLPASHKSIKKIINQERFDILHVQVPYNPFLAKRIIKLAGRQTAVIGTFHILPYSWVGRLGSRLLAVWLGKSLKRFDSVMAVSKPASTFARHYFHQPITVMPNVIDPYFAKPSAPSEANALVRIVFLGRLVKRKGSYELLKALKLVNDHQKNLNLAVTLAGKGPLLSKLQHYVRRNQLDSWVNFAGYVSEAQKYNLLASADLAVFPALSGESFGIVLIEAMAASHGVVLAGNNPGYASVMDGHNDQLVNPSDIMALADKLLYFIQNAPARHEASVWQQCHARTFDVNFVGPKIVEIYKAALHKRQDVP